LSRWDGVRAHSFIGSTEITKSCGAPGIIDVHEPAHSNAVQGGAAVAYDRLMAFSALHPGTFDAPVPRAREREADPSRAPDFWPISANAVPNRAVAGTDSAARPSDEPEQALVGMPKRGATRWVVVGLALGLCAAIAWMAVYVLRIAAHDTQAQALHNDGSFMSKTRTTAQEPRPERVLAEETALTTAEIHASERNTVATNEITQGEQSAPTTPTTDAIARGKQNRLTPMERVPAKRKRVRGVASEHPPMSTLQGSSTPQGALLRRAAIEGKAVDP
jgi:hypothetical protein